MKNLRILIILTALLVSALCANSVLGEDPALECIAQNFVHADSGAAEYELAAKRDLLALMSAYPGQITGAEAKGGLVYIVMQSGNKILYDDKKQKSYEEKLADADLQDTMEMLYPLEDIDKLMEGSFDPGRIRSYSLLKEVYGAKRAAVEGNLKSVQGFLFNKSNGAAEAIEQAFGTAADLIASDPTVSGFVYPLNGTFNYRCIAGTNRLSPHAFGIAIDLGSGPGDYWRWASREQGQKRLGSYPKALVSAFEDCGFVWGGKWAHFDILHFEYRPEIIIKSRYFEEPQGGQPWHYGFPDTEQTEKYIGIIDAAFGSGY